MLNGHEVSYTLSHLRVAVAVPRLQGRFCFVTPFDRLPNMLTARRRIRPLAARPQPARALPGPVVHPQGKVLLFLGALAGLRLLQ